MPWKHNERDPLESRRRQLEEQERLLAEQRRRLTDQLQESNGSSQALKPAEPPVWRLEDDSPHPRLTESMPVRKRNLARQRQRDRLLFFIFISVLVVVLGIVFWIAHTHNALPTNNGL